MGDKARLFTLHLQRHALLCKLVKQMNLETDPPTTLRKLIHIVVIKMSD